MPEAVLCVRQVMQADPVTMSPDRPVREALDLMNRFRVGAVVVTGPARELAGIFSERDLLRRVAVADPGWRDLPLGEWMTADPYSIGPDVGWEDAVELMERLRVRHMPVVEDRKVIGILSTRMLMGWRGQVLGRRVEERTRELRAAHDELLARDTELRHNLRAAGRLQTRLLLPQARPEWPDLRWGVHFAPFDHLGGDYYDFAHPDPHHLGIFIADASGHSIAAAMVAIMCRFAFATASGRTVRPGDVLSELNERLQGLTEDRFVTAFYGVLNRRTREFTYANAGHPYPLWYSARSGEVKSLAAQGFLLGIMPGEQYREKSVVLEPGDRLCFYTDGVVEARNEIGEAFGTERLRESFLKSAGEPADAISKQLIRSQREFRGPHPDSDDVTLLVAELREGENTANGPE
jgi:serine phosphatase RsbU (regulator of sigma subunit)/CBS domain-containing protein